MKPPAALTLLTIAGWWLSGTVCQSGRYLGREVGALSQLQHGVRGRLYAVDSRTLFLKDFHYDGEGPTAYFYVGTSKSPGPSGAIRLRDERGSTAPLKRYRGESITLSLPDGKTLKDVRWFSVWCDEYAVNFGDVAIPRELEYPRPARVGALRGVHGVSSDPVVVVDAQTLLIPHFSYDGEAPDAKFWVGRGDKPSPQGIRIPDENGKESPLRRYDKKTIVLTLPGELTVFDIGHFAVWCEAFTVNFGHVVLPSAQLANVPPSLKMLGVSPQSKLNCEVLNEELAFEVRWAIAGDSIVLQLVSKLAVGDYMAFGLSGKLNKSEMVGGDPAVVSVDNRTLQGFATDYYLDAKSQCAGVRGTCPDVRLVDNTDSITLLNAAHVNGYSIVTYQRSLKAADELDKPIFTNISQAIIWAVGPLNSLNEASFHHHYNKEDVFIEFGRPPVWNCPTPESEEDQQPLEPPRREVNRQPQPQPSTHVIKPNPVPPPRPVPRVVPWEIPAIQCYEPPDGVFYAQMGPTGGKQGYSAITGHVGWGISWYINGLLIPEINVVRGKKYTFVVEGGTDPEVPAKYHPFYITNDPVGGYQHKSAEERKGIEIYAGVRKTRNGEVNPIGVGRLCNWTPDTSGPDADEYPSFGAYQRSLTLVCEEGNPGVVTWIPDKKTPDTVYYQCFTHRHLGWKINVVDECDVTEADESRVVEHFVKPDDLESMDSIQVHSRTNTDAKFLDDRRKFEKIINMKTNYDNFSSYKDGELTGEVYRTEDRNQLYQQGQEIELPISNVQIQEVIETVENIENKIRDDFRRNTSKLHEGKPAQYQVHEDVNDFISETPITEDDEYFVDTNKRPENYLLPPNQKPLTLQSVLRPGQNRPSVPKRPFRRPVPPEIKLRRPPPQHMFQKTNTGYPLSMPNAHGQYAMKKPPQQKFPNNRPQTNRPQGAPSGIPPSSVTGIPLPTIPPMKSIQHNQNLHYQKPSFTQVKKQGPKSNPPPPSKGPVQVVLANSVKGPLPVQTQNLNLGNTDIIANHVVKSQILLPGAGDAIAQQSVPQAFLKPGSGQIILGKPIDIPLPLDQQILHTKHQVFRKPQTPPPIFYQSSTGYNFDESIPTDMKSSDFIGETVDESAPTYTPAVNTGFKPDSIVVESGFKPIIREPLMAAEDRIAEYETNSNRREDTDVEEDYEESPQPISSSKPNLPSEKLTETFEPMFIPSPPDHILPTNDRTKEIFPSNHAKEDRPHPVYVKTESELNALFSKKNMDRDVPSDMVMASDRVSPHYLPPDPKLSKEQSQKLTNEQTFTTYDGKTVSAATLTGVPNMMKSSNKFSSKLPANPELLLKMPQFGPFKGEIPPPVAAHIGKEAQKASKDSIPIPDTRTTRLKLVSVHKSDEPELDDLKADGSEKHEVKVKPDEEAEEYEEEYEEYDAKEKKSRRKRESKTTVFQRGEVEEQTPSNRDMSTKNQIDFDSIGGSASKTTFCWTTVVLLFCVKLF